MGVSTFSLQALGRRTEELLERPSEGVKMMDKLISMTAAIDALTDTNLKRNVDSLQDGDMNRARRAAQRVIANLPTIDTIPVEWLCQKMREEGERENILHAEYIKDLIWEWHNEQEAQDG